MVLDFTDALGPTHFEFAFTGLVLGGSLAAEKGLALLRREVAIFDQLEAISDLKPCGKKLPNGEPDRQLRADGPRQIELTADEIELLGRYLGAVPWQAGTPAKRALATIDWLIGVSQNGQGH